MSPTIPDQILEYLRINHTATVTQLALSLHITRQDIRYHLKTLFSDHLVEKLEPQERNIQNERGRPAAQLRIATKSQPNNYAALAAGLLKNYLDSKSKYPDKAAGQLARWVFKSTSTSTGSIIQVINSLVELFCSHEYKAHWEAHAAGPRVIFENCPYAEIIQTFPELCSMDLEFINQYTGKKAELSQRFDTTQRKPPACIFKIIL